jgi:hypothetical protein
MGLRVSKQKALPKSINFVVFDDFQKNPITLSNATVSGKKHLIFKKPAAGPYNAGSVRLRPAFLAS